MAGINPACTININAGGTGLKLGPNGVLCFGGAAGTQNSGIGCGSFGSVTVGKYNISRGDFALNALTSGCWNLALGCNALRNTNTGNCNVSVGRNTMCGVTSGCNNTAIGTNAGTQLQTGNNNTIIGYGAQALLATSSNSITLGNASIATIRAQVTSITALSDYRDKTYIETLPVGLEFLRQVRPVKFTWNMRGGSKVGQKEAGFIAQELKTVTDNSTIKDWLEGIVIHNEDKSRYEAAPGKLLPLIVKAIQELAEQNDALTARIVYLETIINKQPE